jgi:hypothetical protein
MYKKGTQNTNDTSTPTPKDTPSDTTLKKPQNGDNQRHPYQSNIESPFQMMRSIEEDIAFRDYQLTTSTKSISSLKTPTPASSAISAPITSATITPRTAAKSRKHRSYIIRQITILRKTLVCILYLTLVREHLTTLLPLTKFARIFQQYQILSHIQKTIRGTWQ